ncbi:hypothetical protein PHLGIDRAFT_24197 [Phlebiopsis gigantea 11061_1 CR5-6]|uniref:Uncharacterized protein n=1 Tax=Phlebiopsis gigantea (strain 11061_1 CR5-6) TaxID=745531 RepID=A0A0C3SAK0_PHLG1|nr:hypothetical protein PHLGIDRAFT_24197 [Phlebiopsis gigantea 11061_1 CR5-6]
MSTPLSLPRRQTVTTQAGPMFVTASLDLTIAAAMLIVLQPGSPRSKPPKHSGGQTVQLQILAGYARGRESASTCL